MLKIHYARDRFPDRALKKVASALAGLENKESFSHELGFGRSTIYRAIDNGGIDMTLGVYTAICDKLKIDPATGDSVQRQIKGRFIHKRVGQPSLKESSSNYESELPDEIIMTEDEAELILTRRKRDLKSLFESILQELDLAQTRFKVDPLIQSQIRRIKFEADETIKLLASAKKSKPYDDK